MAQKSDQVPLSAPRGRSAHNFEQKRPDWEAAVFDDAESFSVVDYQQRPWAYTEFTTFRAAMEFAANKPRACVYAVTESGRNALLDKVKWAEWAERESRAQSSV